MTENVRQSLYLEFVTASPFGLLLPVVVQKRQFADFSFSVGC